MLAVRASPGRSEQIARPRPVGEDNVIFSAPEECVCNTICSLNGARRRAGGRSRITAATVLPETAVGVCRRSVSTRRFVVYDT